jgi:hypothetical protein
MAGFGSEAERVVQVEATFDMAAAERVRQLVGTADDSAELQVDLTRVRDFEDRAIAILGDALVGARGPVSVRGLGRHQVRMLRYLGVPSGVIAPLPPETE